MPFVEQKRKRPKTIFGRNLSRFLKQTGWSYGQLARRTGISRVQIYRLAVGQREPLLETANKIAAALLIGVEELSEE